PDQQGDSRQVFKEMVAEITRENPGLEPHSPGTMTINGMTAEGVQGVNRSANSGRGEHDWIVGVAQNGAMRYFVFVAPEADFGAMFPTFDRIVNSIRLQ